MMQLNRGLQFPRPVGMKRQGGRAHLLLLHLQVMSSTLEGSLLPRWCPLPPMRGRDQVSASDVELGSSACRLAPDNDDGGSLSHE